MRLTLALREGTRAEHEAAERSPWVAALLAGEVDAAGYAAYLRRLRPVYAALEEVGPAMLPECLSRHPSGAAKAWPHLKASPVRWTIRAN